MEKIAIVQIDIQDPDLPEIDAKRRNDKLIEHSIHQFRHYAGLIAADYHLFTEPVFTHHHPQLEIFRVLDMDYDRILTVDTDVIINSFADIFEHSHPTKLSACWRPDGGDHINSGVLIWGSEALLWYKQNVDIARAAAFKNRDQDEINLLNEKYPAFRMSSRFNDYTFKPHSYFHHYKGGSKHDFSSR